jgi:hypothetical protein
MIRYRDGHVIGEDGMAELLPVKSLAVIVALFALIAGGTAGAQERSDLPTRLGVTWLVYITHADYILGGDDIDRNYMRSRRYSRLP